MCVRLSLSLRGSEKSRAKTRNFVSQIKSVSVSVPLSLSLESERLFASLSEHKSTAVGEVWRGHKARERVAQQPREFRDDVIEDMDDLRCIRAQTETKRAWMTLLSFVHFAQSVSSAETNVHFERGSFRLCSERG